MRDITKRKGVWGGQSQSGRWGDGSRGQSVEAVTEGSRWPRDARKGKKWIFS